MNDKLLFVASGWLGHSSPAYAALARAVSSAGLRIEEQRIVQAAAYTPARFSSNCIVALGDEAARAVNPAWTGTTMERRGYVFEAPGAKMLASIDPEVARNQPVPWSILLANDIRKARSESRTPDLIRPAREVHVVSDLADARRRVAELEAAGTVAFDIEIYSTHELSCIGFADSSNRAVVFPARYAAPAYALLRNPGVRKIAQNGQFDLHFLFTRVGVRVEGYTDDTMVAWHACYPELAGAQQKLDGTKKSSRRTHKSLAFLASLFTGDAWWKDYEFKNEHEMFVLNGRDCCITYDIHVNHLEPLIEKQEVGEIYQQGMSLIWPCVEMQAAGVPIDNELREHRIEQISERIRECDVRLDALALPLIEDRLATLAPEHRRLFEHRSVCACCRNGAGKRAACWSCAGFAKSPGKRELAASGKTLGPCAACGGAGEERWIEFNGASVEQKRVLLYEILRLPRRYKSIRVKGKKPRSVLSTDEDTLRSLIACTS